jgi:cytochrome c55X
MREAALALLLSGPAVADGLPEGRVTELARLVVQDCGSCHGLTLAGGLGPDIRPGALAGDSPVAVAAVILDGRPGTAMPPWRPLLTEAEAAWIAGYLLEGAP